MGMSGDTALTLAKSYVKKTLQGQGALKGQDGFSPIVTENKDNTDEIYKLDITTKDGTFTTPNLKGFIGADGFSPIATVTKVGNTTTITLTDKNGTTSEMIMDGETNIIESVTVNGVAAPISDKTVNIDTSGYVEKEDGKTLVSASDVSQIRKNKDDIATLNGTGDGSVDKKIADKLSEQTYLTKKIITADEASAYIADPHTAKFNIIYLVKDESASGSDKYFEYQRIGTEESSTFEMTGDTSTDLSDYAKITDVNTELDKKEKQINDLKMLGWTVPIECPIQNYVDSDNIFHQRVGRVEISTIVANESMFGTNFRLVTPTDCKKESYLNGYCKLYQTVDSADYDGWNTYRDNKSIGFLSTYDFIIVKDDTYADETTFKNAMKSVYLYYELATEKTIKVDGNEAVTKVNDSLEVIGKCKNLLKPTLTTTTTNGVTCTANGDGTYTLNGTYDNSKSYMAFDLATITLSAGNYNVIGNKEKTPIYGVLLYTTSYQVIASTEANNKNKFSLSDETKLYVKILVRENATFQNEVFKPMITTNLNATYDDFVPYTGDGDTLMADVASLNNELGSTDISAIGDGTVTSAISAVNDNLEWKLLGKTTSGEVSLPSDYKEINVILSTEQNQWGYMDFYFSKQAIDIPYYKYFRKGFYISPEDYGSFTVSVNQSRINVAEIIVNGVDKKNDYTMYVYYK